MKQYIILTALMAGCAVTASAQSDSILFDRTQSAAAVSVISQKHIGHRSAKDIGNDIIGQGAGLYSKQASGNYASANPTFYVRGLQSSSSSSPLILVDGVEREIKNISAEEVEDIKILKDAAAVALYGFKGVNGVILITTKRGEYNSKNISFTYDHEFNFMNRKPEFVDAATYASAVNEARGYEGLAPKYTDAEIAAFRDGTYPDSYANVDWMDEVFRNMGSTNRFNIEFKGGGDKFRYFAVANLLSDKGFLKNTDANDGYSTQNKYVKGNVRVNLDADLTSSTKMQVNVFGSLAESSRPGASTDLWDLVYSVPSAAFPVKTSNGLWGGNATWSGTKNPVAQAQGAAYAKNHTRSLMADVKLAQDLSCFVDGLSVDARISYDNAANVYEDHSKTYVYGMEMPSTWENGVLTATNSYTGGTESAMGTDASTNDCSHQFFFDLGANYRKLFGGKHLLYTQLHWNFENRQDYGINTTVNRQDVSWYSHYAYANRYLFDFTLVGSASNRLAPGHKWAASPTVAAAWVLSEENFMGDIEWVNFLKFRASAGIINADYLPGDGTWNYYVQSYRPGGTGYMFTNTYTAAGLGSTTLQRLVTTHLGHEKANKLNVGLEATLLDGLDASFDYFVQRRSDIWVESSGKYTDIVGVDKPYEPEGIVNSHGYELSLDYTKNFGELQFNIGGNLSYSTSEIKEELEEPRMYDNLVETGHRLNQIFGYKAIGFFQDQADIDNSPTQTFSTVRPGDVKYEDVTKDGKIDANDKVAIGYNTTCPEYTYNVHLGLEYKGIGLYAMLQGVGHYSAILNAKGMYKPLISNASLSKEYYDNRWTPENTNAKYPRLSSESNSNNYQTSTLWLADRSYLKLRDVEVYYKLPANLLEGLGFVQAARVYVRGTDLFCFDHIKTVDPENYGVTNPMTTSVVAGLTVTF